MKASFTLARPYVLALLLLCQSSWGLVVDDTATLNLDPPPNGAPWNNVGSGNGASGVYLKNGWVISARHVYGGSTSPLVTFNGTTYAGGTIFVLTNPDNTPSDVVLFNLGSAAAASSEIGISPSTPAAGEDLTLVGYGAKRSGNLTNISYTGGSASGYLWDLTGGTRKSWGINQPSGDVGGVQAPGNNAFRAFATTFTASGASTSVQAAVGDSGGGVFVMTDGSWKLAGTMNAIRRSPGQTGNSSANGNQTYIADLPSYASQINSRLDSNLPVPSVNNLSPGALAASNSSQVLTVSGSHFVNGARVQMASSDNFLSFADTPLDASFIDASTLAVSVSIPASGVKRFRVVNPDGKPSGFVSITAYPSITYGDWLSQYPSFSSEESLPSADPDYDGLLNLLEYAFGSDPSSAGSRFVPLLGRETSNNQEYLTLTYDRDIAKTDLSYQVQVTTDLTSGEWINISDTVLSTNGSIEQRRVRVLRDEPGKYLRVHLTR